MEAVDASVPATGWHQVLNTGVGGEVVTVEGDLLTVAEAARVLRVSASRMRRWLKQGRLPSYRVGPRGIRIRREDLDRVATPVQPAVELAEHEAGRPAIRRLTEEEKRRGCEALEASKALIAKMRARRGGQPFAESWPMIREAREERSRQLLGPESSSWM